MNCLESAFAFRGMLSILFLARVKFVNVTEKASRFVHMHRHK